MCGHAWFRNIACLECQTWILILELPKLFLFEVRAHCVDLAGLEFAMHVKLAFKSQRSTCLWVSHFITSWPFSELRECRVRDRVWRNNVFCSFCRHFFLGPWKWWQGWRNVGGGRQDKRAETSFDCLEFDRQAASCSSSPVATGLLDDTPWPSSS